MTVRTRFRWLWFTAMALTAGVVALWIAEDNSHHRSIEQNTERVLSRSHLLSDLNAALGYGGLIHSLKNYVLRGDGEYVVAFNESSARALHAIEGYLGLPSASAQEQEQVEAIRSIIDQYRVAMDRAIELRAQESGENHRASEEIDALIRIDDRPGFHALGVLTAERDGIIASLGPDLKRNRLVFFGSKLLVAITGAGVFLLLSTRMTKPITKPVVYLGDIGEVSADEAGSMIRERHDELRAILDALPAYVYFKDSENTILNLNRAAADAIGLPIERIVGRKAEELFPAADAAGFLIDDREVLRSGVAKQGIEELHETEGRGQRVIVTDKIPLSNAGAPADRLVAIATDVTEIRNTERALDIALSRLEQSLRHARQGAWELDIANGGVTFSDTWYTMLGYEAGEFPASIRSWQSLIHPDDLETARAELEAHTAGESVRYDAQMRMRCKDGGWRWVRAVGESAARDGSGRAELISGMLIDIDAEKRLAEQLQFRNEELERFVYTASHDLKSPIVTVLGFLEHLDRFIGAGDSDGSSHCLEQIRAAAGRMKSNVDDLLEVSRVGRMVINPEQTDLENVMSEITAVLAAEIEEAGATIRCELEHPTVWCDSRHIRSVLENLTGNALKHGRTDRPLVITIRSKLDALGSHRIEVEDNGPGIPAEYREQVFRIFERLNTGTPGSGVGLAIVRKVASIWGGTVEIESADPGTRFVVMLPEEPATKIAA